MTWGLSSKSSRIKVSIRRYSSSDDHERSILSRLKQQCGAQFTSKVGDALISDVHESVWPRFIAPVPPQAVVLCLAPPFKLCLLNFDCICSLLIGQANNATNKLGRCDRKSEVYFITYPNAGRYMHVFLCLTMSWIEWQSRAGYHFTQVSVFALK
jgi:hypothetical protein